ncbi:MAG TPA: hypothetical protein VEA69_03370 [Tepidisphaeraceae bacterium]|nr:hypothetical protein [Tepidisphaeraceae bacterium]
MSIPVLIQVYDETRRLAIAGGAVAAGNFRLKKLVEPLEKSGEKAPVFAKVAQAVKAVVESTEKTASAALLELATLVNAILYTQGETGAAGELKPIETVDLGGQATQASARVLKPLLEALTSTGSGRIELVKDAVERGTFKDLRLVKPALKALDDPYPEIGQLVAEKVLPTYGKAILGELRSTLNIKGKGGHVQRLQLMHRLDSEGTRETVKAALADGSKEMRVAAIECLGTGDDDLAFLLEQSKAKAKDVRAAALRALAGGGAAKADAVAALKKAIAGDDLELFVDAVKRCTIPEIGEHVVALAEGQLAELLKTKDKKAQGPIVNRLMQLVSALDERTDDKAEALVVKLFEQSAALAAIKSDPAGADLNELVAHVMSRGTPKVQKMLVARHKDLGGGSLSPAYFAARATMTPAAFYDEFAPLLKGLAEKRTKKNADEYDRGTTLLGVISASEDDGDGGYSFWRPWMYGSRWRYEEKPARALPPLDPRWLDAAVDASSVELVCELARPGHAKANKFLADQLAASKKSHEALDVLRAMVRVGHPDATDAVVGALKKQAKETSHYYFSYWYGPMVADLPKAALPKIEELLPTLPDKMVDQLMESVMALKNKTA